MGSMSAAAAHRLAGTWDGRCKGPAVELSGCNNPERNIQPKVHRHSRQGWWVFIRACPDRGTRVHMLIAVPGGVV
jgi:hypothetical protein